MGEAETLLLGVEVLDVQRIDCSDSEASMPKKFDQRMGARGILKPAEIFQHILGLSGAKRLLSALLFLRWRREENLLVKPLLDCIDGLAPFDEYPERFQLRPETDLVQVLVLLSPDAELVERPIIGVIQIVESVLLDPADEMPEPIAVCLYRSSRDLSAPVGQEHLLGFGRRERFEILHYECLELPECVMIVSSSLELILVQVGEGRLIFIPPAIDPE